MLFAVLGGLPLVWSLPRSQCSWGQCWWWLGIMTSRSSAMVVGGKGWRRDKRQNHDDEHSFLDCLPLELLCNIVARLPPRSAAVARCVCRAWNKMVVSQPGKPVSPWCLVSCSRECWAFDPDSERWSRLSLPTEPDSRSIRLSRHTGLQSGLLGFTEHEWGAPLTHYWIGNPLTGNWRRIECTTTPASSVAPSYTINELLVDGRTGSYQIVQFCIVEVADCYSWSTHIYDSVMQTWRPGAAMAHARLYCMTSCVARGVVYFLLVGGYDSFTFKVMGYVVKDDLFQEVMPAAEVCVPHGNLSWGTFQLFATDTGAEVELGVVAGLACGQEGGDLDEDFEWPLDRMCVLRFDKTAKHWLADPSSQICIKDCCKALKPSHDASPSTYFFLSRHFGFNTLLRYQRDTGAAAWSPLPRPLHSSHLLDVRGCWRASIGTFLPRLDARP